MVVVMPESEVASVPGGRTASSRIDIGNLLTGIRVQVVLGLGLLLCAALLFLPGPCLAGPSHLRRLEPTGDPLLDAYLELQLQRQFPTCFAGLLAYDLDPVAEEDIMEMLLQHHGPSPEYWQLRVINRIDYLDISNRWVGISSQVGTGDTDEEERLLEQAAASGQSDFACDCLLMELRLSRLRLSGSIQTPQAVADSFDRHPQALDAGKSRNNKLRLVDNPAFALAERAELLAVHERYPNQGWPCYRLAMGCFRAGEMQDGWTWLKRGNQAADCDSMELPYPIRPMLAAFAFDRTFGNDYLSVRNFGRLIAWTKQDYVALKRGCRAAAFEAGAAKDRAGLDALDTFACRMGSTSPSMLDALVAVVLRQIILRRVLVDLGAELTAEQRDALLSQILASSHAKVIAKGFIAENEKGLEEALDNLGGINGAWQQYLSADDYGTARELLTKEFSEVLPKLHERFDRQARFNLLTMAEAEAEYEDE